MKNLPCLLLITGLSAVAMLPLSAQEIPPNLKSITVSGTNEDGFPLQGYHANEPIIGNGKPTVGKGTFIFFPDRDFEVKGAEGAVKKIFKQEVGFPVPAKITVAGAWKLAADNVRNPVTAKDSRQISVTNSIEISEETAHEFNASVAVMGGVDFEAVKAEVTLSAGYAYTASHGKAVGEAWTHTVGVAPGQGMQGWQRLLKVTYEFDTSTAYKDRSEFLNAISQYWGPIKMPGNATDPTSYAWHVKNTGLAGATGMAMGVTGAAVVDFEKFKRFGKQTVVVEIPYPEFYATYYQIPQTGQALKEAPKATKGPLPEFIPNPK